MMKDEAELLSKVIAIADRALDPSPNVTVPMPTLWAIAAEVNRTFPWREPDPVRADTGDLATMLMQCLIAAARHGEAGDLNRMMRWQMVARTFLPFLRVEEVMFWAAVGPRLPSAA
jgi:hypothetical protein